MSALYTAVATATGDGRNGEARTDDGQLAVDLAVPKEMGGAGGATNPEQLFAVGYAACFHSALRGVAGRAKVRLGPDATVAARVGMTTDDASGLLNHAAERAGVTESQAATVARVLLA